MSAYVPSIAGAAGLPSKHGPLLMIPSLNLLLGPKPAMVRPSVFCSSSTKSACTRSAC